MLDALLVGSKPRDELAVRELRPELAGSRVLTALLAYEPPPDVLTLAIDRLVPGVVLSANPVHIAPRTAGVQRSADRGPDVLADTPLEGPLLAVILIVTRTRREPRPRARSQSVALL